MRRPFRARLKNGKSSRRLRRNNLHQPIDIGRKMAGKFLNSESKWTLAACIDDPPIQCTGWGSRHGFFDAAQDIKIISYLIDRILDGRSVRIRPLSADP